MRGVPVLEFVGVEVGTGASHTCTLCPAGSTVTYHPTALIADRIAEVAPGWSTGPGPNVLLTGPEPFDHPELPALVAACVEAGVERIALETDAAALSVPANAAGVLGAGVRHLWVRVLETDDERGDRLQGRQGRTRDTLAGIKAYLAAADAAGAKVTVTALVPVCRHNLAALPEIVAHAATLGLHAVRLIAAHELPASASGVIAAACDTGMVNRLWVETDGLLPLPATHRLHAMADEVRHG